MAAVYEAEDTSLGRRVAVKVLHPQFNGDEAFLTRFDREAKAVAGLKHPSIADVYDIGRDAEHSYIVMELVNGQSLKELIKDGPLPPERVVDIGVQIGKALQHAHAAGVVHRDVKSQNILVSPDGAATLVDFGIAVARGASSVTEAGTVLGTVHYIAPEQARGESAVPASDIYALGVVLYEIATGRLPFEGDSPIEIATKHVSDVPVPPSQLNPRIPLGLEQAILHALEKDPAARPADAGQLVRELLFPTDSFPTEATTDQKTRVVPAAPIAPPQRQSRPEPASRPTRPVENRPRRVAAAVVEPHSAVWPIYVLAAIAALMVLGLIPLWSTVLRG
jgi:serine/threonine-protein kinase